MKKIIERVLDRYQNRTLNEQTISILSRELEVVLSSEGVGKIEDSVYESVISKEKASPTWIYESNDNGATIFRRPFGSTDINERKKVKG